MRRFRAPNITRANAPAVLRAVGARNLGAYGEQPIYNESEVFQGTNTEGQMMGGAQTRPMYRNNTYASLYPFSISSSDGSVAILPSNERRTMLVVQNQSETDNLFFNLSGEAGENIGILLAPGAGIIFDVICPNNAVQVFMSAATNQPGIVLEAAPTL